MTTFGVSPPSARFWVAIATAVCEPGGCGSWPKGRPSRRDRRPGGGRGGVGRRDRGHRLRAQPRDSDEATTPGRGGGRHRRGRGSREGGGRDAQLPRDPVRRAACWRAALAATATARGLAGNAERHRVRQPVPAGGVAARSAEHERGLPVPERLHAGFGRQRERLAGDGLDPRRRVRVGRRERLPSRPPRCARGRGR